MPLPGSPSTGPRDSDLGRLVVGVLGRLHGPGLDGPAPALPGPLDRLAEAWAGARPRVRWALGATAVLVVLAVAGLGAVRSPWGPARAVLLAARELPAGHVIQERDLVAGRWPSRLVPPDAPSVASSAAGRALSHGLPPGSLLTAAHLASGGVAAHLAPGRAALPIPLPEGVSLAAGQRADLVAGDGLRGGERVASNAEVLSVEGSVAWVAVDRGEAPAVAGAARGGLLTVAVLATGD